MSSKASIWRNRFSALVPAAKAKARERSRDGALGVAQCSATTPRHSGPRASETVQALRRFAFDLGQHDEPASILGVAFDVAGLGLG
jgi:hypothetical protein